MKKQEKNYCDVCAVAHEDAEVWANRGYSCSCDCHSQPPQGKIIK